MVVVEVILVSGGGEQERERAEVDCDIDPRLILRTNRSFVNLVTDVEVLTKSRNTN